MIIGYNPRHRSLGQRNAPGLADQVLVVQHGTVPRQLQEVQQSPHLLLRAQHQLLVAQGQTAALGGPLALAEHGLRCRAPLGQAVPVAAQVKARDGDLGAAVEEVRRSFTGVKR